MTNSGNADSDDFLMKENNPNAIVKQTILEILEAPRLTVIDITDLFLFKERRKLEENCTEQNIKLTPTSYHRSIDESLLGNFITAIWVNETTMANITEVSL